MTPTPFPEQTAVFDPPADAKGIVPLPVRVSAVPGGVEIISCWRMSWPERWAALRWGRCWLIVMGKEHPPVAVQSKRYLFTGPRIQK